jgi:hypothetical protein
MVTSHDRVFAMRLISVLIFIIAAVFSAGCGSMSYRLGNETLFPDNMATVHVPIVRSESFRPGQGEQLTEAIVKEIENRTPYKVVGDPNRADSTLIVHIVEDQKTPRVRTSDNQARQIGMGMCAEIQVFDRGQAQPRQLSHLPIPQLTLSRSQFLIPEAGQSVSTTQLRDMERLAADIVSALETPW